MESEKIENKRKIHNWTNQKSKLNDWFHYSIEINVLKDDYENFNLRKFEVKIKRQGENLSMTNFKIIKVEHCFLSLLGELINKLNMYSCYIKFNNSSLLNLNVYDFYNNYSSWRDQLQKIYETYDKKENKDKNNIDNCIECEKNNEVDEYEKKFYNKCSSKN